MQRFIVHLQYNNDVIIRLFIERVQSYTSRLKNIVFFVILTFFIAINRFSTFFRLNLKNDSQDSINSPKNMSYAYV